jgi:hypothetical protein
MSTGNNPQLSNELIRRAVRIHLDAECEHPDVGRTFSHPDLRQHVVENRGPLIWAICVLVQAWIARGCPRGKHQVLGGFESWSSVIGGILEVAGISGFLENRSEARSNADAEMSMLRAFLEAWWAKFQGQSVGVAELFSLGADLDLGGNGEQSQRVRLGRLLHSVRDRNIGGFVVKKVGPSQGKQMYRLQVESRGRET